jgi:tripartite-type tricarboxylate transporter receptor subunit TctC
MFCTQARRVFGRTAAALIASLATIGTTASLAQTASRYPEKPITWIVGFPPGGSIDGITRLVAKKIESALGQSVVIDNRPGASGAIAMGAAARATPDGYTLVTVAGPDVPAKAVPELGKELAGVAALGAGAMVLVGTTAAPMPPSLKDLLAAAKASPDKYTFGSSGIGSSQHLAGELINQMAGTKMTHVPYKGGGEAVNNLLGGQLPLAVLGIPPVLPHIRSGKLKAYGVTTSSRSSTLPDVPTLNEAGLVGFDANQWYVVATAAGVPADRIQKLNAAISQALKDPEIIAGFLAVGVEPFVASPQETVKFVMSDQKRWRDLAQKAKISLD